MQMVTKTTCKRTLTPCPAPGTGAPPCVSVASLGVRSNSLKVRSSIAKLSARSERERDRVGEMTNRFNLVLFRQQTWTQSRITEIQGQARLGNRAG